MLGDRTVRHSVILAIAVALGLLPSTRASGAGLGCPPSLLVNEKLARPVDGWIEGRTSEPHRLAGITTFDGKPEELASLVGDERALPRKRMRSTWGFEKGREYCRRSRSST